MKEWDRQELLVERGSCWRIRQGFSTPQWCSPQHDKLKQTWISALLQVFLCCSLSSPTPTFTPFFKRWKLSSFTMTRALRFEQDKLQTHRRKKMRLRTPELIQTLHFCFPPAFCHKSHLLSELALCWSPLCASESSPKRAPRQQFNRSLSTPTV